MEANQLAIQVHNACRHLLSELNRDPYTPTYGCFDRRYWGWKLVDYPEATFQRNVYPLAWLLNRLRKAGNEIEPDDDITGVLTEAVKSGLAFAFQVQHKDGSFDQAFPNEHSFGATAFLLHPLLKAYQVVQDECSSSLQESVTTGLRQAAEFLYHYDETHGHIANHLAGAVLSLMMSAKFFKDERYTKKATNLLDRILAHQSAEGWFLEYEGADPGYQTLCLYYLAQVYRIQPDNILRAALDKAVSFISWFVHPDGTFGGEYGSRRTAVYYPGGLALLSNEFQLARSITRFMLISIIDGRTTTLQDIDLGNLAPLLSNYLSVLEIDFPEADGSLLLPCERAEVHQDFSEAGLYVRSTPHYYAILGASNGGVLKVFNKQNRKLIWNDGGYVGQTGDKEYITTQITDLTRSCQVSSSEIKIQAPFYFMLRSTPTPGQFVLLRLLNLTVMRSVYFGNLIKGLLVRLLISGKKTAPVVLSRTLEFKSEQVIVTDTLRREGNFTLRWLEFGRPFVSIHMASSRYFENFSTEKGEMRLGQGDVKILNDLGEMQQRVAI